MDHFARLDGSVNETNVCIVDETGRIVREVKVASEPDALLRVLTNVADRFKDPRSCPRDRRAGLTSIGTWRGLPQEAS